jgi:hypothetical protein
VKPVLLPVTVTLPLTVPLTKSVTLFWLALMVTCVTVLEQLLAVENEKPPDGLAVRETA